MVRQSRMRTVAPIFSPPSASGSILVERQPVDVDDLLGRLDVQLHQVEQGRPARTNRVPDFPPAAIALSASSARWNSNDCMELLLA